MFRCLRIQLFAHSRWLFLFKSSTLLFGTNFERLFLSNHSIAVQITIITVSICASGHSSHDKHAINYRKDEKIWLGKKFYEGKIFVRNSNSSKIIQSHWFLSNFWNLWMFFFIPIKSNSQLYTVLRWLLLFIFTTHVFLRWLEINYSLLTQAIIYIFPLASWLFLSNKLIFSFFRFSIKISPLKNAIFSI